MLHPHQYFVQTVVTPAACAVLCCVALCCVVLCCVVLCCVVVWCGVLCGVVSPVCVGHVNSKFHLQDEMEPICIDSDDDVHAPGSGPAREGNQNGAAIATRHSTRSNRFQSTTQVFKVMLPPPDARPTISHIV